MTNVNTEKLSSARFAEATDAFVEVFTASVDFDKRMAAQDIQGSLAHAKMLARTGILTEEECAAIEKGLAQIAGEIERGEFTWSNHPPHFVQVLRPIIGRPDLIARRVGKLAMDSSLVH